MDRREYWRAEIAALKRVFLLSDYNSLEKTVGTILLMGSWTLMFGGLLYAALVVPDASIPAWMATIVAGYSGVVLTVFGRWYGIEVAWQHIGRQLELTHREHHSDDLLADGSEEHRDEEE